MNHLGRVLIIGFAIFALSSALRAQRTMTAEAARDHEGSRVTACGWVANVFHHRGDAITYLDLNGVYPNQALSIVIPDSVRATLQSPPEDLRGQQICATGPVAREGRIYRLPLALPADLQVEPTPCLCLSAEKIQHRTKYFFEHLEPDIQQECLAHLKRDCARLRKKENKTSEEKQRLRSCKIAVSDLRGFIGPDPEKHRWDVFIEAGVQGSTLNSVDIAGGSENPGLFEDNNAFGGFQGEIRGVILRNWDLAWQLRFGHVDIELSEDITLTGKKVLNDAETLLVGFETRRALTDLWYAGVRVAGYTPTDDAEEAEIRTDLLGEYHAFAGVKNKHAGKLRGSYLQAGYGRSERFLHESRVFAETALFWQATNKTKFFAEFVVTSGSGADDIRALFGARLELHKTGE